MGNLVLIMLGAALFIAILLLVVMMLTRKAPSQINKDEFRVRWLKIEQSVGKDEQSWHMAIMNADKLLDAALKARRFSGETMGDRLKAANTTFRNRNAVWVAHKVRNRIAHESDVKISLQATRNALKAFKAGLRDLGAL